MNITEFILTLKNLFSTGGLVMLPLFICALLLWYGLGYRFWLLRASHKQGIRDSLHYFLENCDAPARNLTEQAVKQGVKLQKLKLKHLHRHLDAAFYEFKKEIGQFSTLIRVVVIIAPLLGLLGTVIGMIETFDSLATMTLFSQSGGIAGGISQALITTQVGLAVAIPGVLLQSVLNKKQKQIEQDLMQLKDLLCQQTVLS